MNSLLIIPKRPFPPYEDGDTLIYYYLTKYLQNLHIFYFYHSNSSGEENTFVDYLKNHHLFKLEIKKDLFSVLFFNFSYYKSFTKQNLKLLVDYIERAKIETILCHVSCYKYALYLKKRTECKIILHAIDCYSMHYLREISISTGVKRIRSFASFLIYSMVEKNYNKFDGIVLVSDFDKKNIIKHGIQKRKIHVINNGVDTRYFTFPAKRGRNQIFQIGFSGVMNYAPNENAVLFFLKEIFPEMVTRIPHIKYYIIGKSPTDAILKMSNQFKSNVVVTGFVQDIRIPLGELDLYVSTLRSGSGIKNKILEVLSMGIPVIASPISLEGMALESEVIQYSSKSDLIEKIQMLYVDSDLRKELSQKGRQFVQEKYSWEQKILGYAELLR